jgi:hypothetical protein
MKKYKMIGNIYEAIEAIESYYENVAEYINFDDQVKNLLEKVSNIKKKFTNPNPKNIDEQLKFVHYYVILCYLLDELYVILDFNDIKKNNNDISNTKSIRIGEMFNKITTIYKSYIMDVSQQTKNYISKFIGEYKVSSDINTIKQLNKIWKEYPQSIQLYQQIIKMELDTSYQIKQLDLSKGIINIINDDKKFILNQNDFLSALLVFNLVPFDKYLNNLDELAVMYEIILIKREMMDNSIYMLSNDNVGADKKGITLENAKFRTLVKIEKDQIWDWSIKFNDNKTDKKYVIVEQLADNKFRVLTQNKFQQFPGALTYQDPLIQKIFSKEYGRPAAYYTVVDQLGVMKKYDDRVANLFAEDASHLDQQLDDVGLNIMSFIAELDNSIEIDDLIQKYEKHILTTLTTDSDQLENCPTDLLFLWIEKSKSEFLKELEPYKSYTTEIVHQVVGKILKKNNNIFQELIKKSHKLTTVAEHSY